MWRHVSKYLLLLFLAAPFAQASYAETVAPPDTAQNATYAKDYIAAKKLQQALQHNDRRAVANLVQFPLLNEKPLASIRNAREFLARWDEFFDATNIPALLTADAEQYGWRGIALLNGTVWFEKGKIRAINSQTATHQKAMQVAIKQDSTKLYPSARGYDKITFKCTTKKLYIRAQQHGDDLRYFAWKKGASLLTKPELELTGGKYDPQGTGGNYNLEFNNNGFTYVLSVGHNLCGEDCNDYLEVSKGDTQLSRDVCAETKQ
ncbi:MAG: hypothetical protein ABI230_06580 [Aestuariivirga sp.]